MNLSSLDVNQSRRKGSFSQKPYFFLPANFDAAKVLPKSLGRYVDEANYLVGRVVSKAAMWRVDDEGYARLKVAYLRKVIPWRVEWDIRHSLIATGVLEHDPRYIIGDEAMGYRLGDSYRDGIKRVECKSPKVAARITALKEMMFRTDTNLPIHRHLKSWLEQIDIDARTAREIVASTPDLARHADIHLTMIEMLRSGHVEFSHCKQGRVHSLITRMARDLRPTLSINNQPLINVDVVNSQPTILATLTNHQPPTHTPTSNPPVHTMHILTEVVDSDTDTFKSGDDVKQYVSACERGTIYDDLQAAAGLDSLTRSQLKEKFFREIFFGRNQVVTDFTRLFERQYPGVMKTIREYKRTDYTRLACEMQRSESKIIIHGACARFDADNPSIPLVTVHDSIMTTPPHVETIKQAMLDAFAKVGLTPKLKVESPDQIRKAA